MDEKTQAKFDKAIVKAAKDENKRVIGMIKEAAATVKADESITDKTVKKAFAEMFKTLVADAKLEA